jgi:hypothetical protein
MLLLLYLSISGWCLNIFCIVFVVRNAIFIRVAEKYSNFSYFFTAVRKCGPFCFLLLCVNVCGSLSMPFITFVDVISVIK